MIKENKKFENEILENAKQENKFEVFMKVLMPLTPFLANECLDTLKCKKRDEWPVIDKKLINKQKISQILVNVCIYKHRLHC